MARKRHHLRSPLPLLLGGPPGADRPFLDLDFEAPECTGGWYLGGAAYEKAVDPKVAESGRQSLRMR